jgi:hypothetical protein
MVDRRQSGSGFRLAGNVEASRVFSACGFYDLSQEGFQGRFALVSALASKGNWQRRSNTAHIWGSAHL